jgi:hypothetical protein
LPFAVASIASFKEMDNELRNEKEQAAKAKKAAAEKQSAAVKLQSLARSWRSRRLSKVRAAQIAIEKFNNKVSFENNPGSLASV